MRLSAGLDSFAALNVMEHMSNLAGLGHTVIASIHQPRSAIWDMFDKVPPFSFPLIFLHRPTKLSVIPQCCPMKGLPGLAPVRPGSACRLQPAVIPLECVDASIRAPAAEERLSNGCRMAVGKLRLAMQAER